MLNQIPKLQDIFLEVVPKRGKGRTEVWEDHAWGQVPHLTGQDAWHLGVSWRRAWCLRRFCLWQGIQQRHWDEQHAPTANCTRDTVSGASLLLYCGDTSGKVQPIVLLMRKAQQCKVSELKTQSIRNYMINKSRTTGQNQTNMLLQTRMAFEKLCLEDL